MPQAIGETFRVLHVDDQGRPDPAWREICAELAPVVAERRDRRERAPLDLGGPQAIEQIPARLERQTAADQAGEDELALAIVLT